MLLGGIQRHQHHFSRKIIFSLRISRFVFAKFCKIIAKKTPEIRKFLLETLDLLNNFSYYEQK
jgi:hypothetical protein